jgi:FkbM family methyltransferase
VSAVIDVGCEQYSGAESVRALVKRYKPTVLYGFDPLCVDADTWIGDTHVVTYKAAAWVYDGEVSFRWQPGTTMSRIEDGGQPVRCIDLAKVVRGAAQDYGSVVLKLDCEGAEYQLLEHLLAEGAAERLTKVLVEWHGNEQAARDSILARLTCPVGEWT